MCLPDMEVHFQNSRGNDIPYEGEVAFDWKAIIAGSNMANNNHNSTSPLAGGVVNNTQHQMMQRQLKNQQQPLQVNLVNIVDDIVNVELPAFRVSFT